MRTVVASILALIGIACGVQVIITDVPEGSWADLGYFLGAMFSLISAVIVFDRS